MTYIYWNKNFENERPFQELRFTLIPFELYAP